MGFNIGDKIIFTSNVPKYQQDNFFRGKIGTIISTDYRNIQDLCVDWGIPKYSRWWIISNEVRLAKREELS
jgi:ATP-dependent exoDNAse (exonuclease V) alpha subunit